MPPSFTFPPPPPPPPPPPSTSAFSSGAGNRPAQRGGHQQSRGRARGAGANPYRGHGSRYTVDWDRPVQNSSRSPWPESQGRSRQSSYQRSQKRTYGQAFTSNSKNMPLGKAPPAVPSFGEPLPIPPTSLIQEAATARSKPKKDRTFNQLGLTPRKVEHESSEEEDDEDEEAKLGAASQQIGRGTLQFEHKGQLMTLSTSEDVQAWIAERKKRYPTKAKIDEAIAVKDRLKQRNENGLKKGSQQRRPRHLPTRKPENAVASVGPNIRTGGKRREDARVKCNSNAESSTVQHESRRSEKDLDADANGSEGSLLESSSESEGTSSSGTSEATDDSDDAPLEQSAKVPVAALSLAPNNAQCLPRRDLACPIQRRSGRCRIKGCSYQHTNPHRTSNSARGAENMSERKRPRVSLHQRLLVQQHNEEDRDILRSIIAMGERGILDAGK